MEYTLSRYINRPINAYSLYIPRLEVSCVIVSAWYSIRYEAYSEISPQFDDVAPSFKRGLDALTYKCCTYVWQVESPTKNGPLRAYIRGIGSIK